MTRLADKEPGRETYRAFLLGARRRPLGTPPGSLESPRVGPGSALWILDLDHHLCAANQTSPLTHILVAMATRTLALAPEPRHILSMSDVLDIAELDALVGRRRGRRPLAAELEVVRQLSPSDLTALAAPLPEGYAVQPLARLKQVHHLQARLLAEGRTPGQVCAIVGTSASRLSVLQQDPSFKELIEYYRSQVAERYLSVHEKLAMLGETAIEELSERLESEPEKVSTREIREIAEMALDRSTAPSKANGGAPSIAIRFVGAAEPVLTIEGGSSSG